MTLVFITLASSVDGYVSGRGARAGLGLGDGFRIFDWLSDHSAANRAITAYDASRTGAVVSGRNTYEHAGRWGGDSMVAARRCSSSVETRSRMQRKGRRSSPMGSNRRSARP